FLLSDAGQTYFAENTFEYPLAVGIASPEGQPPLDEIGHPDIDLSDLADLQDDLEEEEPEYGALVRKGRLVSLRAHVSANREAFIRWYGDEEIAALLRHDLEPLTDWQARGYFDSFILPSSARGLCFAIHERKTKQLIGTTALT